MFDAVTTSCQRCGFGPLVGGEGRPDALLLRRAHEGVCVSCAITQFIKSTPAMMMGIERNGVEMLRDGRFGPSWARLMATGKSDATAAEIDWNRVVDNWDLPDPKPRRARRRS
jgi:hypothetical protein